VVNRKHTGNNSKRKKENKRKIKRNKKRSSLGTVFDKHIKCEFQDHDVNSEYKNN
jgi:hypothetical protein